MTLKMTKTKQTPVIYKLNRIFPIIQSAKTSTVPRYADFQEITYTRPLFPKKGETVMQKLGKEKLSFK